MNESSNFASKPEPSLPHGLGGWTIAIVILAFLFPLFHLFALIHLAKSPETAPIIDLFVRTEKNPLTLMKPAWIFEFLAHLLGVCFAAYNFALLLAKRSQFVPWFFAYLIAIPLLRIVGNGIYMFATDYEVGSIFSMVWTFLIHLIAVGYLHNSNRVKNTFVN